MEELVREIAAAAATIATLRDAPDVLARALMPSIRRLAVLCTEAVATDDGETAAQARKIIESIFKPDAAPKARE